MVVKPWTTEEIATLHRLYPDGGPKAVHRELPHRTRGTIKVRAHKLGVKTTSPKGGAGVTRKFDPVAIFAILQRKNWSPSATALQVGCSTSTVHKARRLADARHLEAIRDRRAARVATAHHQLEGVPA